ncbi:MAG: MBL fold metallo-hydrolase [Gammaproteobacteria bacterium]|nr:MBL fold metallo-hydrolase [Gammaproteobacteria bacterium]MBT8444439.1 MBL fold metallo-hydrolase [Gammaproteobacteria bacterium]NND37927.1 MBL fold metallo-hydrolase [Gammaproteobacteria bacterium]
MRMPGPFDIRRVQEHVWPHRELDFVLLDDATPEEFAKTRVSRDERFVNVETGTLIMSFHSFVARTAHGNLLVDTCVGDHKTYPTLAEWHQQKFPYLERLGQVGLTPDDIDFVCCTHLHGDHVGWNTRLDNGRWVPTFGNARYLMAADELGYWENLHTTEPDNMYQHVWRESLLPVIEHDRVDRVASDHEILPGIRLRPAPGHTPGNVVIELAGGGKQAVMSGDVIHHPVQIERPDWSSQFDGDPDMARITRKKLLERIADTDTELLGAHFSGPTALRVVSNAEGFDYRA